MAEKVEFGQTTRIGVSAGLVICLGVPLVVLHFGPHLPTWLQAITIILALLLGGTTVMAAVFFGRVIPNVVEDSGDTPVFRHGKHARHGDGRCRSVQTEDGAEEPPTGSDAPADEGRG